MFVDFKFENRYGQQDSQTNMKNLLGNRFLPFGSGFKFD